MTIEPVNPPRPRGRPRNVDGADTAQRLVQAAATVCATHGFDGCTLTRIAAQAGVHPTAIYNHFESRDALLYTVAVRALDQLARAANPAKTQRISFGDIAAMYLHPKMSEQRQILAEIHVASQRHEHLADLLAEWHRRSAEVLLASLPADDPDPRATVQALFLLLLGLCHLDQVSAVRAPRSAVTDRVRSMAQALVTE